MPPRPPIHPKPLRLASLLAAALALSLTLSGCMAGVFAESRERQVLDMAAFDSSCGELEVKDSFMGRRFSLEGCGYRYIYACQNRDHYHHHEHDASEELAAFFVTGGQKLEAECYRVSVSRLIPQEERVAATMQGTTEPSAPTAKTTAPRVPRPGDEPGAGTVPASQPAVEAEAARALPRAPSAADIKRVMTALEPKIKACGVAAGEKGRFQAVLKVDPSGKVLAVKVAPPLDDEVQRCVERLLVDVALPPFRPGSPVTVAYLFDLR